MTTNLIELSLTDGIATLLLGAYIAIFQHDLKGLLAYSTISHLGLITLLLGLNSELGLVAAIFHALFGGTAADWVGPGTGVAGAALANKVDVVATAVARTLSGVVYVIVVIVVAAPPAAVAAVATPIVAAPARRATGARAARRRAASTARRPTRARARRAA